MCQLCVHENIPGDAWCPKNMNMKFNMKSHLEQLFDHPWQVAAFSFVSHESQLKKTT